jgi:acetyl esterase/lipase
MFSAQEYIPICSRYAVETGCTLVNVEYRLNPEFKSPKGIMDGYATLKWVISNAEALGIDRTKICLSGESGGGYICTGVAMHAAKNDESHLIKLLVPISPMTSDEFLSKPIDDFDQYR